VFRRPPDARSARRGAPATRIEAVRPDPPSGWSLELRSPRAEAESDAHAVVIAGALGGDGGAAESVRAVFRGRPLRSSPLEGSGDSRRFRLVIGTPGLPERFTLGIQAMSGARQHGLARIEVSRSRVRPAYEPMLRPLIVSCLPRSGSTRLMQLIAAHPEVVAGRRYPLETYAARWWLQLVKVASDPADFVGSLLPNDLGNDPGRLGNPPHHLADDPPGYEWMGRENPPLVAGYALSSIDAFYRHVAETQGEPIPVYFAEKWFVNAEPYDLFAEFYPGRREVALTRDLRDVYASQSAFTRKNVGPPPEKRPRLARRIQGLLRRAETLLERIDRGGDAVHLVRYEDFVADPQAIVDEVFSFIGVEGDAPGVRALLATEAADERMAGHVTSASITSSVGRWRTDVDLAERDELEDLVGPLNARFGYGD
jgi:LPS sulfotransferase NodH